MPWRSRWSSARLSSTPASGAKRSVSSSWNDDASQTTVAVPGSAPPASVDSAVPTLPTTSAATPAARCRWPISSTVVVLPLEPVTAISSLGTSRQPTSSSPITPIPASRAATTTGACAGTPGLLIDRAHPREQLDAGRLRRGPRRRPPRARRAARATPAPRRSRRPPRRGRAARAPPRRRSARAPRPGRDRVGAAAAGARGPLCRRARSFRIRRRADLGGLLGVGGRLDGLRPADAGSASGSSAGAGRRRASGSARPPVNSSPSDSRRRRTSPGSPSAVPPTVPSPLSTRCAPGVAERMKRWLSARACWSVPPAACATSP